MKKFNVQQWVYIALFNFLLVALLGALMRYKIAFEFPILNQKYLQHAHSHFAFAGWVGQLIMVFMVATIAPQLSAKRLQQYQFLILFNFFTALGMLVSFTLQGYGLIAIIFSCGSLLVNYIFSFIYYQDLKSTVRKIYTPWFKGALLLNVLSTVGTFLLIYIMVTRNVNQHLYLESVYGYLHFQYNGWFLFACIGLFLNYIKQFIKEPVSKNVFRLFAFSVIPAYGLSVLWADLSWPVYLLVIAAAIAQTAGWWMLLQYVRKINFKNWPLPGIIKTLFVFAGLAFSLKIMLQLFSVVPAVSQWSFGFRPIVIAYLHLVLLAFISMFLLMYAFSQNLIRYNKMLFTGLILFTLGVLANELLLAIQGVSSIKYILIPYVNEMLFGAAVLLFLSLLVINISQCVKGKKGHLSI